MHRSASDCSAAASAASTFSTLPARSPTTVFSCAAARRRGGIGPDYRPVRTFPRAGGAERPPRLRCRGSPPAWKACPVQSQRDYVLRTVEERGIRFVQLWFTDVL